MKKISKRPKQTMESRIRQSIINKCYSVEFSAGDYTGDGVSLANEITTLVAEGLLPKQQRKIYDAIPCNDIGSVNEVSTLEIAKKCSLSSKLVSAQLKQIFESTELIGFRNDGRKKLWFRR